MILNPWPNPVFSTFWGEMGGGDVGNLSLKQGMYVGIPVGGGGFYVSKKRGEIPPLFPRAGYIHFHIGRGFEGCRRFEFVVFK